MISDPISKEEKVYNTYTYALTMIENGISLDEAIYQSRDMYNLSFRLMKEVRKEVYRKLGYKYM